MVTSFPAVCEELELGVSCFALLHCGNASCFHDLRTATPARARRDVSVSLKFLLDSSSCLRQATLC